ncbi:unnamed protein product, partial [Polarella glacialis]
DGEEDEEEGSGEEDEEEDDEEEEASGEEDEVEVPAERGPLLAAPAGNDDAAHVVTFTAAVDHSELPR